MIQEIGTGYIKNCDHNTCRFGGICDYDAEGIPHCICSYQCPPKGAEESVVVAMVDYMKMNVNCKKKLVEGSKTLQLKIVNFVKKIKSFHAMVTLHLLIHQQVKIIIVEKS